MKPKVLGVIPARMESRRFDGKVLHPYRGRPLLYHVWREVRRARRIDRLVIATDNTMIRRAAEAFGAEVVTTSCRHRTGTDRVAEVAAKLGGKLIINIQADNFGLTGSILDRTIKHFSGMPSVSVATLAKRVKSDEELFDPSLVKVLIARDDDAIWFSRYPLPYLQRSNGRPRAVQFKFYGHIGVYLFTRSALRTFAASPRSALEKAESLEQLRVLEHGGRIRVFKTAMRTVSVDCPDDMKKLAKLYK